MLRNPLPSISEFNAALTSANVFVQELIVDSKGTICGPDAEMPSLNLPLLEGEGASEIVIKRQLSKGGMGEILLAEQRSLGREVAVKVTAAGKGSTLAVAELVVEARVAGQLEHPNIVPIHILGKSSDGKPLIVMKRIEGDSWKTMIDAGRDLARDVDILKHVCRALEFAHARGVVHRDVKPANVMVGRFGEVYLLDWGIAVGFGDQTLEDLPHARDVSSVSGTPTYMAPEMTIPDVDGDGDGDGAETSAPRALVDQRTDVFLVGAVLYEMLTGEPPHSGRNLEEILFAAHTAAEPVFPVVVDEELEAICKRAMKRDPADRYQSIADVREALEAFERHADARELTRAAEERLAALVAMPDGDEVARAFTECRFGFTQALRAWPESARAKSGLERAIVGMLRRETDAGHYDSARMLAAELEHVPPDIQARLDELGRKRDIEAQSTAALAKAKSDQDLSVGAAERLRMMFGVSGSWLAFLIALHVLAAKGIYVAKSGTFALCLAPVVLSIGGAGVVVKRVRENAGSRTMFITLFICVAGTFVVHLCGWHFGVEPAPMLALAHLFIAVTLAFAAAQDARLWKSALVAAMVAPAVAAMPSLVYIVSGVGTFGLSIAVARASNVTQPLVGSPQP